jgi:hypothetical protein
MSNIIEAAKQTSQTRHREPRSRGRKERSTSSLVGMFDTVVDLKVQEPSLLSADVSSDAAISVVDSSKYSDAEKQQLAEMTRRLRKAKRRLFLKSVGVPPSDSVERLREILLRISFENEEHIMESVPEAERPTPTSSSSSIPLPMPQDETIQV